MNPELLTVLSMRQKEMAYLRGPAPGIAPGLNGHHGASGFLPSPATAFGNSAAFITPPALLQSPLGTAPYFGADKAAMARACYSPLSVGQFTHSSVNYDQFGFVWHWITEVCAHFALQRQTAHCAIQYAQRILRQRQIKQDEHQRGVAMNVGIGVMGVPGLHNYEDIFSAQKRLQVLGLACVFIAAKIEEVHPPKSAAFAGLAAEHGLSCGAEELVDLEAQLLEELNWNLHPTTVLSWLLFLLAGEPADQPLETMADFVHSTHLSSLRKDVFVAAISVLDAALLDSQSMDFLPSVLAGSAILLADPALDLVFVAQFLQLDPSLLWECKNWLIMSGCGSGGLDCEGTRDEDRWDKVPEEELLFVQSRVAVPTHLAYGLLRTDRSTYDYVTGTPNQVESNAFGMYSGYMPSACQSPLQYDACGHNTRDAYDDDAALTAASNVYHFKYGWQGGDVGYNAPTVQRRLNFS